MACPGRVSARLALVLCVLLLSSVGCRYHMALVEDGSAISRESFEQIEVGDDLDKVLAVLGAPSEVRYEAEREILEYASAGHDGTDLRFILPSAVFQWGSLLNLVTGVIGLAAPIESAEEFDREVWVISVSRRLFGGLLTLNPLETGGHDSLNLIGQRLRYDRIRVVVDRSNGTVLSASFEEQVSGGSGGAIRKAFLLDNR